MRYLLLFCLLACTVVAKAEQFESFSDHPELAVINSYLRVARMKLLTWVRLKSKNLIRADCLIGYGRFFRQERISNQASHNVGGKISERAMSGMLK